MQLKLRLAVVVNTVKFGKNPHNNALVKLATDGRGDFHWSIDSIQLLSTFAKLSDSMDKIFAPFKK